MPEENASKVLQTIVNAFVEADFDAIPDLVRAGLDQGVAPGALLNDGLIVGIREVGDQFRRGVAYLPEMMLAAESMDAAMVHLDPLLGSQADRPPQGKVVIGTVRGDIHSLGKNIVITLLKSVGFEVIDLGIDVPASTFVSEAIKNQVDIIAISALMTTTVPQQKEVVEHLRASGKRGDFYVMVGGASTTQEWADEIEADGYGATASDAMALAEAYMARLREGGMHAR